VHCLSHRTCCTVIIEHALTGVLETPLSKERAVFVGPYPGSSSERVLRRSGRNRAYQARRRRRPAKISVLSSQKRTADHRPALLTSALEARFHWFANP
jgi:hypothetical protein